MKNILRKKENLNNFPVLWHNTKSGSIDSTFLTKHKKYQGNPELLSYFEKPAFIQYRLLWIYSISCGVCNNSTLTPFAVKLPDQQLKKDHEKKKKMLLEIFSTLSCNCLTLYRYI